MNRRIYYDGFSGLILAVTDGRQTVLEEVVLYRIPGYLDGATLVLQKELTAYVLRNLKNYRIDPETEELAWNGEGPEPVEPGGGGSGGGGGFDPALRQRVEAVEFELIAAKDAYSQHAGNLEIHRKITVGTSAPVGGENGDIHFRYE